MKAQGLLMCMKKISHPAQGAISAELFLVYKIGTGIMQFPREEIEMILFGEAIISMNRFAFCHSAAAQGLSGPTSLTAFM
jgi:hypothetical protein